MSWTRGSFQAFFSCRAEPTALPAHQVNGACGVEQQACPGSNWNGKPIHYAQRAKPFSLMVFSSKAYTRETIPILSLCFLTISLLCVTSQGLSNVPMHLLACFPGVFVQRTYFVLCLAFFSLVKMYVWLGSMWGAGKSRGIEMYVTGGDQTGKVS